MDESLSESIVPLPQEEFRMLIDSEESAEAIECRIKVIGVGGGGIDIATHLYKQNIPGLSVIACDTD